MIYGISTFAALAYNRFRWKGVPAEIGDVERILTWWGGTSVLTDDGRLLPVAVRPDICEPFRPLYIATIGAPQNDGLYPWQRLIQVAPARYIIDTLKTTMQHLDEAQIKLTMLAKMTRAIKQTDANSGDARELVDGVYTGVMPSITVDGSFQQTDIVTVGDGDTHAQSVSDMHNVALARACQALGIRMDATVKRERLITDEAGTINDMVDIVRQHEIDERMKLASWTGWECEVLI